MSAQGAKSGLTPSENPAEVLRRAIQFHIQGVNTVFPAKIVSVSKNVARVQPLLRVRYADGQELALPIIPNVPVQWPRTSAASLVFKLKAGDTGSVMCAQRSLDEWLLSGALVTPKLARTHSISDAIFVPGLVPHSANSGGAEDAKLLAGAASVTLDGGNLRAVGNGAVLNLNGGKVALGAGGTEVVDVLFQLLTLLGASNTTSPGSPIMSKAQYALLAGQLGAIKGSL